MLSLLLACGLFQVLRPQAKRGMQISGLVITPVPFDSKFGLDEFGDLVERTGAVGNLLINFATASAADAANFVAYMTAQQGSPPVNGAEWAARTREALELAWTEALASVTSSEARHWFAHCGYCTEPK